MPILKAQKVPVKVESAEDVLCKFCYYFPAYKYHQAKKLPYKRVAKMLSIARKEEAQKMIYLTHIVSAPNSKKGSGVKKLLEHFKEIING